MKEAKRYLGNFEAMRKMHNQYLESQIHKLSNQEGLTGNKLGKVYLDNIQTLKVTLEAQIQMLSEESENQD
jgi:hypothetical protein